MLNTLIWYNCTIWMILSTISIISIYLSIYLYFIYDEVLCSLLNLYIFIYIYIYLCVYILSLCVSCIYSLFPLLSMTIRLQFAIYDWPWIRIFIYAYTRTTTNLLVYSIYVCRCVFLYTYWYEYLWLIGNVWMCAFHLESVNKSNVLRILLFLSVVWTDCLLTTVCILHLSLTVLYKSINKFNCFKKPNTTGT